MTVLLGLGGYAKSGKDTVAHMLSSHYAWTRSYMSYPLEQALMTLDPWVDVSFENWQADTYDIDLFRHHQWMRYAELHAYVGYDPSKNCLDVREYLQVLGTEIGRKMFGENVWVDLAFEHVNALRHRGYSVALTGIRFPNELEALRLRGGVAVWMRRPDYGPVNSHASDNSLGPDDFDLILDNDKGLEELYDRLFFTLLPEVNDLCGSKAA